MAFIIGAFLLFFVLTNPETAGPQARDFVGWLADLAGSLGVFLEGVFGDTPPTTDGTDGAAP